MKLSRFFLAGTLTAMLLTACDNDDDDDAVNAQDQTFTVQASMSNRAEIDGGTIASTRGNNAFVVSYGQRMVTEHTTAQTQLASIVSSIGLNVNLNDSLSVAHKALRDSLLSRSGRAFDTVYIKSQIRAHQMTLANFDAEINGGSNTRVRGYATDNRHNIQMHLDSANAIYNRIK